MVRINVAVGCGLGRHVLTAICEQAAQRRKGGNGVDIRAEALAVIERMALTRAVTNKALETQGMRFVDRHGRQRARVATAAVEKMVGSEDIEIPRGDLSRLLFEATQNDTEYVFGDAVTALEQDADGVDVTFAHGPQRRFDLVLGADGIHSGVRRLAFGPEDNYRVFRQHYYAIAGADLSVGERYWTTFYNEPGKSAAVYRAEAGQGLVSFTFHTDRPISYDYRDTEVQRRLLREAFSGVGWHVPAMLDAADDAADFYFDALDQIQMPSWSNGRVVLVGAAAYCASPHRGRVRCSRSPVPTDSPGNSQPADPHWRPLLVTKRPNARSSRRSKPTCLRTSRCQKRG